MKVKELIKKLKSVDQNRNVIFYFLKDANLNNCEYETLLEFDEDNRVELTIKLENSDENGNIERRK